MKHESYEQMSAEASNWLKVGRARLLRVLLHEHAAAPRGLRILEIGAGVGQNVPVLHEFGEVDVLEINPLGLAALREMEQVHHVFDVPVPSPIEGGYDVVVAFDVLEHLADDRAAAAWVGSLLVDGGVFIATVPAYQWLFSDHDRALEHYRRYTRGSLVAAMPAELRVVRAGYFVSLLLPLAVSLRLVGRLVQSLRRRSAAGGDAARKQSAVLPGPVDALFLTELTGEVAAIRRGARFPFGLSVFAVARRASSRG